jgi:predicted house-cleaning noncanonical NTP pyrophosphatase (MazG superfamily)
MGKLVRDLIPEIIRADGREPVTRVLSPGEYEAQLHVKLAEEATELLEAPEGERLEEMADVYEVLSALALNFGFTMEGVAQAAADKRFRRGAFADRVWLES